MPVFYFDTIYRTKDKNLINLCNNIRRIIEEYESLTDENRHEYDYSEEDIKQIELFKKYL